MNVHIDTLMAEKLAALARRRQRFSVVPGVGLAPTMGGLPRVAGFSTLHVVDHVSRGAWLWTQPAQGRSVSGDRITDK